MTKLEAPKDPALRALWIIRNWTKLPLGNMETPMDIIAKVNLLASETYDELSEKEQS